MNLLLRADSDAMVGAGHVMRSLSLGRRWIAAGGSVTLLGRIDSERLRQRVLEGGVRFLPLEAARAGRDDLKQTLAALHQLRQEEPVSALVDGYEFGADYHAAIRGQGFPLLVMDDLADLACYHADVVLNQNLDAERLSYRGDSDTRWLLGAHYALLHPEFDRWCGRNVDSPDIARRILVTVGGSDPHGITSVIIEALNATAISDLEISVVAGPSQRASASLASVAARPYSLLHDVRDMASLMASMDMAISGGGSTCLELAFMGLPAIVVELSDNQRRASQALAAAGAVELAGRAEELDATALGAQITALCLDATRRGAMSEAGRSLVDGRGGARVVGRLGLGLPPLTLRRATHADSREIWMLATDPSVRQWSFDPAPIPWESHVVWFERVSGSPTARMWVLAGETGIAGQVRYEVRDGAAEIGISVAPAFRGFGLAARLLAATWAEACRELGVARARGVVFTTNRPSEIAFREAGFVGSGLHVIDGRECHIFTRTLHS